MDDDEKKSQIKNVIATPEGLIEITFVVDPKELVDSRTNLFDYGSRSDLERRIKDTVVEMVMKDKGPEIVQKVIDGIDWPNVVKSEIAQRVIAEAAAEGNKHRNNY
jgi:hypothetical protein